MFYLQEVQQVVQHLLLALLGVLLELVDDEHHLFKAPATPGKAGLVGTAH